MQKKDVSQKKRSEAGKLGSKKRWESGEFSQCDSKEIAMPSQCDSNAIAMPSQEKERKKEKENPPQTPYKEKEIKKEKELIQESSSEDSSSVGKPTDTPLPLDPSSLDPLPKEKEPIDSRKFVDWFNAKTNGVFGRINYPLGEKRQASVRARVREYGKEALSKVVIKAYESKFLKGDNRRLDIETFQF